MLSLCSPLHTLLFLATPPVTAPSAEPQEAERGDPIVTAYRHVVPSDSLGEPRELQVGLPADYATSAWDYPVLFVVDGDLQHALVCALTRNLAHADHMPPVLVVGVPSIARTAELTPPSSGGTGRADATLGFLVDEAIPFVETNYRAAPFRILLGHSLGGLFATYACRSAPTPSRPSSPSVRPWTGTRTRSSSASRVVRSTASTSRARAIAASAQEFVMQWRRSAP